MSLPLLLDTPMYKRWHDNLGFCEKHKSCQKIPTNTSKTIHRQRVRTRTTCNIILTNRTAARSDESRSERSALIASTEISTLAENHHNIIITTENQCTGKHIKIQPYNSSSTPQAAKGKLHVRLPSRNQYPIKSISHCSPLITITNLTHNTQRSPISTATIQFPNQCLQHKRNS